MSTISGTGFTATFYAGSNDGNANAAATSVSAALQAGTLTVVANPAVNPPSGKGFGQITAGSTTTQLGTSVTAVEISGTSSGQTSVAGTASTGQFVLFGNTSVAFFTAGGSGTVAGGDVGSLIGTPTAGGGAYNVSLGSGNDTVLALTGSNTVAPGGGTNVTFTGQGSNVVNLTTGLDQVAGFGGLAGQSDTVNSGSGSALVFEGSKNLFFNGGSGAATVLTASGSDTINTGAGGGLFGGGTAGGNLITTGMTGSNTIFGGGNGDKINLMGSSTNFVQAGSGNETLSGVGSTGNSTFYTSTVAGSTASIMGGSGQNVIATGAGSTTVDGGTGADLIGVVNGRAGGSVLVMGFRPAIDGDRFTLVGYSASTLATAFAGAQTVQAAGLASTMLTLGDGTKITFAGVTNLSVTNFI